MKKLYYESPTVEVVDVRVEAGFQGSISMQAQSILDYSVFNEGDMTDVDSY